MWNGSMKQKRGESRRRRVGGSNSREKGRDDWKKQWSMVDIRKGTKRSEDSEKKRGERRAGGCE